MAGPATGGQFSVGYIAESTQGTTPATPAFNLIPVTNFSIGMTKATFQDKSFNANGQENYLAFGNRSVTGTIDGDLLAQSATTGNMIFDPFWESLLRGTWTTNNLKVNTPSQVLKTFTIESRHLDAQLTTPIYNRYLGCMVNQVQIVANMSNPVTAKWGFIGMDNAEDTTILTSATYVATPTAALPLVHGNSSNLFKEGGSASAIITAIDVTIAQGVDANFHLGSYVAGNLTTSRLMVTGTVTAYFQDLTLLNKFINGTTTSLEFKLSDGAHSIDVVIPNVYYTGAVHNVTNDNPVTLSLPFRAIYDSSTASVISLTRA
jgi:hypothetical protein